MKSRRRRDSAAAASSSFNPSLSLSPSVGGDIDRLTELPDILRLHILSLLPIKSAIRTGVLSSRWRNLWRFRWPQPSHLDITAPSSLSQPEFVSAVDDFIRLRGCARLDYLQLVFSPSLRHMSDLKRWLDYAASCSVSDLNLDLSPSPPVADTSRLSRRLRSRVGSAAAPALDFNCESSSLTRLNLRGFHLTSLPPSFKKPAHSLEILSLCEVYLSFATLRRILSNCPFLRSLSIRRCPYLRKVIVPSSALRLTRLTVVDCRKTSEISVSSLGLRSFRFSGALLKNYHIESGAALEDIYISSGGAVPAMPRGDWVKPLGELANLKVLTLCSLALEYIASLCARSDNGFRWLPNLVELQLLMLMMAQSNLSDIYSFFKYCPCPRLEKLFIELPVNACDPSMEMFLEVPMEDPSGIGFDNLRILKMNGFKGHLNEVKLAGNFLMSSCSLEHLIAVVPMENAGDNFDSTANMLKCLTMQLHLFSKASSEAHVIVTEHDDLQFRPTHSQV